MTKSNDMRSRELMAASRRWGASRSGSPVLERLRSEAPIQRQDRVDDARESRRANGHRDWLQVLCTASLRKKDENVQWSQQLLELLEEKPKIAKIASDFL